MSEPDRLPPLLGIGYSTKLEPGECPRCNTKGVLFRHPTHRIGTDGYGSWLCMICTMPEYIADDSTYGDSYFSSEILQNVEVPPGENKENIRDNVSKWFYEYTPEMSAECYHVIVELFRDRGKLHSIRKALGVYEIVNFPSWQQTPVMVSVPVKDEFGNDVVDENGRPIYTISAKQVTKD